MVYVASGTEFADAAAAAAIAGQQGAPLLLVQPTAIPAAISAQLTRLAPDRIVVLGSAGRDLRRRGRRSSARTPRRPRTRSRGQPVPTATRTAVDLAETTFSGPVDTVVVVNGLDFADAVSAAPLAALDHAPVLYVQPDAIPTSVHDALLNVLKPTHIVIVGGTAAVSAAVANGPGHDLPGGDASRLTRLGGADRYATAEQVALQVAGGSHPSAVYVASGLTFPDALTGAALAASAGRPGPARHAVHAAARRHVRRDGGDAAAGRRRDGRQRRPCPTPSSIALPAASAP